MICPDSTLIFNPGPLFLPPPCTCTFFALLVTAHSCRYQFKGVYTMNMVIKERASLCDAIMAYILLMINYRKKGYVSLPHTWKSLCTFCGRARDYIQKVHKFNHDPSQGQVVVAKKLGVVVGTVCVECNPTYTPIDCIFPDELSALRHSGQSFIYLGSFAVASKYQCTRLSLRMLRHVWSMVKIRRIDIGVCVVHPDHVSFYERFGFTKVAQSIMPGLDRAPAALLVIRRQDVRL